MAGTSLLDPNLLANDPNTENIDSGFWDQFGRGLKSSLTGTHAGLRGMAGTAAEAMGADEFAQAEYQRARELQAQAQAEGPRVGSYKDVHGLRDAFSYGGGILGGSAPSIALGLGAGMAARTALGGLAAGTVAQTPIEAADVALKQINDPAAMEQAPGERFARQIGGGAASAGLQTIVPNIVGGKIMGRGAQQAATQSLRQVAGRNALAIPEEGFFEGASEGLKQTAANNENDLNWDMIGENVVGGMVGGAPMAGAGFMGDAAHRVTPQAREMFDSARTSINDRLAAAKAAAGDKIDEVSESAPGKKVRSAWEDVSDLVQRGREKIDDTVDKVLNGQELGVDPAAWAQATTDEAKRRLTELSDNEHVKAATKWANDMLADKGLDADKRAEIMEATKNIKDRAGQMTMAGLKKAWDMSRAGAAKVNEFVDTVKAEHEKAKRRDVDVESRTVDEPTAEMVKLGFAHAPEAEVKTPVPEAPAPTPEAPKTTIKDRKAFIEARMAEGMSREEARALFVEGMNGPRRSMPEPPEMPKFSEDYAGVDTAIAKAIEESGISRKRPELFEDTGRRREMAGALRMIAEQAVKGKLTDRIADAMIDVFGNDAPHMINTVTRVVGGAKINPKQAEEVFKNINNLNKTHKVRGGLHEKLRTLMVGDGADSLLSREVPKLADMMVKHARGELTAKSSPAEAQAINESMAAIMESHFGTNAGEASVLIEQAAKQFNEPNMERTGGAEFDEEVLTDENGAEITPANEGFDEDNNRLHDTEQNITRFGLSKANVGGHQRSVVNGAMMHKDSQYVQRYMDRLKEKHSTKDDEGRIVRTADENGYDIRFEQAEGSEFGHIVVEDRGNPDDFNNDELAKMKLDTKRYPKSASRVEVGWKEKEEHESTNSKGVTKIIPKKEGPEHILDATKIMDVMRGKYQQRFNTDNIAPTTARQRMADGFAQGIATLNLKFGSKEHPIKVGDDVVIGWINNIPVTWGEANRARKDNVLTTADAARDKNERRQEEIRALFAKARGITPDKAHTALVRAYKRAMDVANNDTSKIPPTLKEYGDLRKAHQRVLTEEHAGGRDTQEPTRLRAGANLSEAEGRPMSAIRSRQDARQDKIGREVVRKDGTTSTEYAGRGAARTDNNSFASEMGERKDKDKDGNIHALGDKKSALFGANDAQNVFYNEDSELMQRAPQGLLDAKGVKNAPTDVSSDEEIVHRSNMDGSGHWAGNSKGVSGLTTLQGTIISEWSKTPGEPAKKLLTRVKRLVQVAASMSKADVEKLRMLAPDPLNNVKGGVVDYNDRYTANNTLAENLAKMTEKMAMKELTRRENLLDEIVNKRSEFAGILQDEIAALEGYIDAGKFGSGAGIQDSLTLGEAAPVINELARKYQDVVVPPGEKSAGPIPAKRGTKQPVNPAKFVDGINTTGDRSRAESDATGHWERKGGKSTWVPAKPSAKTERSGPGPFARNIAKKQDYLNNPPDDATVDDFKAIGAWAEERVAAVQGWMDAETDTDRREDFADKKNALILLSKTAKSRVGEGTTRPKSQAPAKGVNGRSGETKYSLEGVNSDVQIHSTAFKEWYGDWTRHTDGRAESMESERARALGERGLGGLLDDAGGPVRPTFLGGTGPTRPDGKPATYYHGSRDDISFFARQHGRQKDAGWLGRGVYLTNDPDLAHEYARVKRRPDGTDTGVADQNVMPLYAAVKNPYFADLKLKRTLSRYSPQEISTFTKLLRNKGYDGVVLNLDHGLQELVAFEPGDVKSAIGNNGEFDGNDPRVNRSAESTDPTRNNAKTYTSQDIKDHVEKVLAKSVKLAWATFTHAGQFDRTKAGDFIRLSIHALDPMSTAYHESLHAFFAQLRDAGAYDIIGVVQRAAASEHVIKQLNERFKNQPEVLKQLKDPEERAAYMYQMWAADPKGFKVSIAARTTFEKIKAFIRKVMGTWSDDERAVHIMNYFHEGKYAHDMGSPSAVRHALMETHKSQILETAKGFTEPLGKLADALVGAGGDRLRNTGVPALKDLADIIKRDHTVEGGDQGFIQASRIQATKMRGQIGDILDGLSEAQLHDAMEALQVDKPAGSPEARLTVKEIKRFLKDVHGYMVRAGVKVGNLGPDYFPRVWDTHYISKNQQAFRDMLEPYVRRGELEGSVDKLISRLISRDGSELGIETREVPQPGMQHTKERLLAFITPADAAQFVEKNIYTTLTSYVGQAARKAEWTRRLGGGKLEQIIADAKGQGATKENLALAEEYMKGVDGTLGDGMNPTLRRLTGNMLVYQNVRLLPMAAFSMLVDPVGIVVRGGELGDAWGAFKRGMKGVTQTFSKSGGEGSDQGTQWAELVGAVDTAMMSHVMGDVYSQGMVGGTAQKINNAYFKFNFVEGLNRNFRIGAVEAAVRFIGRHAGGLDGLGDSTHSKRWMRELGLRRGDVKMVNGRIAMTEADGLTPEQVVRVHAAVNQWVDGAVLRPDAADKPIWMNDPHFALIAHLKQFVFTFQKVIIGRVMHEMRNGNYTPMMALGSYVPIMIAVDTAKGLLQGGGDTPEWKRGWDMTDYVGYGIQRAGLLGVGQFGLDIAEDLHRGGTGIGALTGPTIEQMGAVLQTLGGKRSVGSTVMDALPANALYKEIVSGESGGEPMFTS